MGAYGKYMFEDERISWSIDGGGKFFYRTGKYSLTNVSGWMIGSEKTCLRYLYYALLNEWSQKHYDYQSKAHPSVIRGEYTVTLPIVDEQKKIALLFTQFDNLITLHQCKFGRKQKGVSIIC